MSKVTELVYASLRRRIISGDLRPGAQVKEEHVASDLCVSRTPVRAAITRLVNDGMLTRNQRRGAYVTRWARHDIEEVYALRTVLESLAAELAAQNATPAQITELTELTDRIEDFSTRRPPNYLAGMQKANSRFHHLLLLASGSQRLREITETLVDMPQTLGMFYLYAEADIRRSIQHHRDVIAALEERNPQMASEAMRVHLRTSRVVFLRIYRDGRDDDAADRHH